MRYFIISLLIFIGSNTLYSQNTIKIVIKDNKSRNPLPEANAFIEGSGLGASADTSGFLMIRDIPNGIYAITFSFIGYEQRTDTFCFPLINDAVIEILLEKDKEDLDAVVISSTRSTRTIRDIPTRVEFIAGEELEEKGNMKAGDIRMLLSESTGIQTQQTSAISANASIRIQGLDGRYTQLLKDGFPLYSGASSGLGLLQTPPLDLKQVEVIKGSASTLYGGGAIAGLVNLISKTPTKERELRFHLNGSSGKGFDLNGYYGKRFKKVGLTLFGSHNRNWAYDPANINLSAIPKFERYLLNPKLFIYFNKKTDLAFGLNTTVERRLGGDMHYIKGENDTVHRYFELNKTKRYSTQLTFKRQIGENDFFTVKNSISYFNRIINIPGYGFEGTQIASFTEANYSHRSENMEWIIGGNLWTDDFKEKRLDTIPLRNYNQVTTGAFIQNTWKASRWFSLETGFRTDYVVDYGFAYLPRVSTLFKITKRFTSRLGGGLGYKAPTIFTEESERIQYKNVLAIDKNKNRLEQSYGGNWDFNYRTSLLDGKITLNLNHLFFYTYLDHPLLLQPQTNGLYQFNNINGHTESKGSETNLKIGYGDFKLFLGYTFTDTRLYQNGISSVNPLTPKHRVNSVLMWEQEDKWKVGLEAYYFSPQRLSDGSTGRQYVLCGFMAEKLWEQFSVYINFENFLDQRQTRFDAIYTGTVTNPVFKDIYAPLDGFLINGGIKIKL